MGYGLKAYMDMEEIKGANRSKAMGLRRDGHSSRRIGWRDGVLAPRLTQAHFGLFHSLCTAVFPRS